MFKCLQIMCAKYYELRCMFKKNFTSLMLARAYSVKIGVIFGVRFERQQESCAIAKMTARCALYK